MNERMWGVSSQRGLMQIAITKWIPSLLPFLFSIRFSSPLRSSALVSPGFLPPGLPSCCTCGLVVLLNKFTTCFKVDK